ncbi:MAG TPA: purine-nucleoside phosphorylase [Pirellulaceae bacterium]|nr:purine-nucleoside phosphorylase [Pirellulaceae bacterium]
MNPSLVSEAVQAIGRYYGGQPRVGLILGTGLGRLVSELRVAAEIPYAKIPYFPRSTAMAHKGDLLCGSFGRTQVVVMAGRCHLYEGYSAEDLTLPVHVLHALGVELLIVTNAAGGLNPSYQVGDVMVLADHINLMFPRRASPPSAGDGVRMPAPYDTALIERSLAIARQQKFPLRCGVYVGVKGPNYETRAEYRAFRKLGGDVVGMSTIPEVLCARALGMRVLALSTVTNIAREGAPQVVTPAEVVAMAGRAEPKVRQLVTGIVAGCT